MMWRWKEKEWPGLLSPDGFTTPVNNRRGWGGSRLLNGMTAAYKSAD